MLKGLTKPSGRGGRGLADGSDVVLLSDDRDREERDDALDRDDSESDAVEVICCAKTWSCKHNNNVVAHKCGSCMICKNEKQRVDLSL